MIYQVGKIVSDVRVAIDNNFKEESLIKELDEDTLSLDELIVSKIEESAKRVLTGAPVHLLEGGKEIEDAIYWNSDNRTGWILLPDDFLRLIVFRMSDWERPVYEAITAEDPRYQLQFSRCNGIKGTPQKPVVAIVSRREGLVMEFFSCKSTESEVENGYYLTIPKIDRHGGIDLPERCYRAVVYTIASMVLLTLGQNELASILSEISKQIL